MKTPKLVSYKTSSPRFSFIEQDENFYLVIYCDLAKNLRLQIDDLVPLEIKSSKKTPEEEKEQMQTPEDWHLICHQTGGYSCHHKYILAKFLEPKPEILELFKELQKYDESCIVEPPNLEVANIYQKTLQKYNLSAKWSYHLLEEGFYPVDLDCIQTITNQILPENIQDLAKKNKESKFIFPTRFELAILGPNCD